MPIKLRPRTGSKAITPSSRLQINAPHERSVVEFPTPASFNTYLVDNGTTTTQGLWLKIPKKGSPTRGISIDEAIDTALCHGWIDGQRKALSATHFLQRFTPRRRRSLWSKRNVAKATDLIAQGRMTATGLAEVDAAKADGRWDRAYATGEVPGDFERALAERKEAREVWDGMGKTAKGVILWRFVGVVREETRRRKIEEVVEMLAKGGDDLTV